MRRSRTAMKPVAFLLSVTAVFLLAAFWTMRPERSAAKNVEMGMRYLNEYHYDEAIPFFLTALEQDPNNTQARIALARAYRGRAGQRVEEREEDLSMALELLDPMVSTFNPHPEAAEEMIEILRESGSLPQALSLAQRMIETINEEEYYRTQEEICRELWRVPRSYAEGSDYILCIQDARVFSSGANALGQLGVPPEDTAERTRFQDAQFPGAAFRAACAGNTSYIIAEDGTLWAAGDDLWGQMGREIGASAAHGTWNAIFEGREVVATAGTTGRTLALLSDGTVWTAGAGSGQSFSRLGRFSHVMELTASSGFAALLTVSGDLYLSRADTPGKWDLQARNVLSFTLSDTTLCLLDKRGIPHILPAGDNGVFQEDTSFLFPESWFDRERYLGCTAVKIAQEGSLTLLLSADGSLWSVNRDGTAVLVECPPVRDIYPQGKSIVLELSSGAALLWTEGTGRAKDLL